MEPKPSDDRKCEAILFVLASTMTIVLSVLMYLFARDEYEYHYDVWLYPIIINGVLLACSFLGARWFLHVWQTEKPVNFLGCSIGVICGILYMSMPINTFLGTFMHINGQGGPFFTPTPLTFIMNLHTFGWTLVVGGCLLIFIVALLYNCTVAICCPSCRQIDLCK
jgi:hypothetical protein